MKVHGPSVALGFAAAFVAFFAARRLRPVAVEFGALAIELVKMGRAVIELQRENVEDFFCEVQSESAEQAKGRREERKKQSASTNPTSTSKS